MADMRSTSRRKVACILIAATVLCGCSTQYKAERLLWKAQRLQKQIVKQAEQATPQQYIDAIRAYEVVIESVPGTEPAGMAQEAIGSLYIMQKQFEKARQAYQLILQNYASLGSLGLRARVVIAKSYEMEKKWDQAVRSYRDIAAYHPFSPAGLEAPIYVGKIFAYRKQKEQAAKAYQQAVRAYLKLIPDSPTPQMQVLVKQLLAGAYQELGEWKQAVSILEEIRQSKEAKASRPFILVNLARIYQTQLGETQKAQELYAVLAKEYPKHPIGKFASGQLSLPSSKAP
ncbi:MAG: tetratricopeptide repeat protein [Candidatus Omnitrophica bacterium]|nr:tetratricopeptide repeat protein [Candidatus Omnitrophota bacterium]MBI3010825.1 tetratricopeptide repeat protein [Candidatus Omnitrophota bacterium]